ncbi:hypothetical protein [Phytobacter massiliensis]|uniref:hypothetical protein n=1 Tax=Phytobacter massiliensis TaxID=1485952 RepID=UPI000694D801|nr:hypothetical protein [Phytobacter massiliensis]
MIQKMKCFYSKDGTLINIGPWDYQRFPVYDNDGFVDEVVTGNPLPDGAYEKEMDVVVNEDGSRSVAQ